MQTDRYLPLAISSMLIYIVLHIVLCPDDTLVTYENHYTGHVVSVFVAFFLWPAAWIFVWRDTDGIYGGLPGVVMNIGGYAIIGLIFMGLFNYSYVGPGGHGVDYIASLAMTVLNVIPVDFFIRKVVQHRVRLLYGDRMALASGLLVWLGGHIPEYIWLSSERIGSPLTAAVFLLVSGIVTTWLYHRTEDVAGQMAGHVLMNVMFSLV